jgi:cellulose synthase/poly-beta-1,6-N-acetylglucosamine synthase-like glycosyltransferase
LVSIYSIIATVLIIVLLPFVLLVVFIGLSSLFSVRQLMNHESKIKRRFCLVIPAHNEQDSIEETLESVWELDYPRDFFSVVVIADNCTDQTADVSRSTGALVVERFHETKKSKGYALEHFFNILDTLGLEAVDGYVIIDADTKVDPNLLFVFNRYLEQGFSWLQAFYTVSNPKDHWRTGLMKYALSLFNGVWLYGQQELGLGSALRGNGMCFSAEGLERFPWHAYGLTEDLEFAWRLRIRGEKVAFVPETKVYGEMVVGHAQGVITQRQRWEQGRSQLRRLFTHDVLKCSHFSPLMKGIALADLWMLPLSRFVTGLLLTGLWAGLGVFLEASALFIGGCWFMSGLGFLGLGLYGLLPTIKLGMPLRDLTPLGYAPFYMVWKLFVSLKPKPRGWVRTPRNAEKNPDRKVG